MEVGIVIKNLIIIGVIGGVVFASQSAYFKPTAQKLYTSGVKSDTSYVAKATDWLKTNIYPRLGGVSGEVAKTQDSLQEKIVEEKNNLVEKSTDATKKVIAEKFLQLLGVTPQELGACTAN